MVGPYDNSACSPHFDVIGLARVYFPMTRTVVDCDDNTRKAQCVLAAMAVVAAAADRGFFLLFSFSAFSSFPFIRFGSFTRFYSLTLQQHSMFMMRERVCVCISARTRDKNNSQCRTVGTMNIF